MPKIYRQKDIEQLKPSDVSQEFVDYYHRLSDERRIHFADTRPDLYAAILAWRESTDETHDLEVPEELPNIDSDIAEARAEEVIPNAADEAIDRDMLEISNNVYEGVDIPKLIKDDFRPVEALTIGDNQKKCPAHRIPLIEYNPKFRKPNGKVLGMVFYHCPECNRLFIKRSRFEPSKQYLDEWAVPYRFFDFDLSNRYLLTQVKPYEFSDDEKIYIPDQWIEENPVCPLHESALEKLPCVLKYGKKSIAFDAYYCETCKKVQLRRTSALNLEDQCAEVGIPLIEFESLAKKVPPKVSVSRKEIRPDYYMNEGKRLNYAFGHIAECYKLSEMDTVVVSDSVYCTLDGHNTEMVLGMIWVQERANGYRKSYLFMLGYCTECQKYFMDEIDYKAVYQIGRPEVNLLVDMDNTSYMISSGEVFDIERKHLKSVEDMLFHEMKLIRAKPDYVSPYSTQPYYDDGDLSYRKAESKKKYEGQLEMLSGYMPRPYGYRVDISANGKTEVYYIGSNDININHKHQVISANSKLGRELVHYQTVTVKKDGLEYHIKLSRQFDIYEKTLYGYLNLRTDEDIIFRSGVTDPFLVRVLNMRKKQHNLIDIFVTIQENQNSIVDAPLEKNLIIQGCAGSGKTMVLLHRLSSLKYNRPDFNFGRDAFILTPNDHFTLHIKGLAESLQIGSIGRASVEQYYADVLGKYAKELKPIGAISSEMSVNQAFVDFVYSDEFKKSFEIKYHEVINARNELVSELHNASELMGEKPKKITLSDDSKVVPQLTTCVDSLVAKIDVTERKIAEAASSLKKRQERKESISAELPKKRDHAVQVLKEAASKIKTKAFASLLQMERSIDERKKTIIQLNEEKNTLERTIESAEINNGLLLTEYTAQFSDWINNAISEKLRAIEKLQSAVSVNQETRERLERTLSIPFDEVISSGYSEDADIARILVELLDDQRMIEQLQNDKIRVENGWALGRTRRLSAINSRLDDAEKSADTHKLAILEVLESRRNALKNTIDAIDRLIADMAIATQDVKDSIKQNQKIRLNTLNGQISKVSSSVESDSSTLRVYVDTVNRYNDEMDESQIISWQDSVAMFVPEANDEMNIYHRLKNEIAQYEENYNALNEEIASKQVAYEKALEGRYSEDVRNVVRDLQEKIARYSVHGTYQMVFDAVVQPFKEKHAIKAVTGKYHRYDLYARLIFAMKYFGKAIGKIKFLCVDEAQDLARNEYKLISELNSGNVIWNFFGDTNQLIKPNRGIADWSSLKAAFQAEQYVLNENYRNTNQITRFCNASFGMTMLQTGVDGAKVREITRTEFNNELNNLHISTERIAVLLPRGIQKRRYINYANLALETRSAIGEEIGGGKIAVMYVDEVKGIEFDKVYVVPNKMGRNEKYIAYTRALSELVIVNDDSIPIEY